MSDTTTSTIVCSECGWTNEQDATFCGACGAYLEWDGQRMGPPEPEPEAEEDEPPPPPEKLTLLERVKAGLGLDGETGGPGAPDGLGAAEAAESAESEVEVEQPQQDAQPEPPEQREQPRPPEQRERLEPAERQEPFDQPKPPGAAAEPERPADRIGKSEPSEPSEPSESSESSEPAKPGQPAAPEVATRPAEPAAGAAAAAAAAAALVARPEKQAEQAGKAGTKAPSTTSAKTAATTASAKGAKPGGAKATSAKAGGAPQARKPGAAAPQARKPGAEAQPRQPAAVKPGAEAHLTGRRKTVPVDEHKPKPGETICGQCGAGNAPERRFCRRCGHDLEGAAVMSPLPWWRRIFQRRHKTIAAGTRPVRRRKRKWPRRLITVAVILGILYAIAWYALPQAGGPIDALRDRIQGTERFEPSELVASSSSQGRGPQLARDGRLDTSWAPAPAGQGVGQYLEARFDEPFRLVAIQIFNGGSRQDDVYLKSGRPENVTFTITKSDGTVETRDVSLRDDPDQQDIILGINDVEAVRMTVKSSVGSTPRNHINLGEMAFFTRS